KGLEKVMPVNHGDDLGELGENFFRARVSLGVLVAQRDHVQIIQCFKSRDAGMYGLALLFQKRFHSPQVAFFETAKRSGTIAKQMRMFGEEFPVRGPITARAPEQVLRGETRVLMSGAGGRMKLNPEA